MEYYTFNSNKVISFVQDTFFKSECSAMKIKLFGISSVICLFMAEQKKNEKKN